MTIAHLNEEQLQLYALGDLTEPAVVAHVEGCIHCQARLGSYQLLYDHIRLEEVTSLLDSEMERYILSQLPLTIDQDRLERRYIYMILLGAIALVAGLLIGCWQWLNDLFSGITTAGLVFAVVLCLGWLAMHGLALYNDYMKKIGVLNPE